MTMARENKLCRICGEGNLTIKTEKNRVEYKGISELLDFSYASCDGCGSEQADAHLTRINKRLMIAFRKRVDGLLTGAEVRALREKFKLNQGEAAQVFGGGPIAFSKYESDDVAQSEAMDKLLRLASELPAALGLLCRRAGVEHPLANQKWQNIGSTQRKLAHHRHQHTSTPEASEDV